MYVYIFIIYRIVYVIKGKGKQSPAGVLEKKLFFCKFLKKTHIKLQGSYSREHL